MIPPRPGPTDPTPARFNHEQLDAEVKAAGLDVPLSIVGDRVYAIAPDGSLVDPPAEVLAVAERHAPTQPPAPPNPPAPVVITGSLSTNRDQILAKLLDAVARGAPVINQTRP